VSGHGFSRAAEAQKEILPCAAGPGSPTRASRGGVEASAQRSEARYISRRLQKKQRIVSNVCTRFTGNQSVA